MNAGRVETVIECGTERMTGPYWMLRAMIEQLAVQSCNRWVDTADEQRLACPDAGDCVTEWCPTCLARLAMEQIEPPAEKEPPPLVRTGPGGDFTRDYTPTV